MTYKYKPEPWIEQIYSIVTAILSDWHKEEMLQWERSGRGIRRIEEEL